MLRKIWRRLTAPTFSVTTKTNLDTSTGAVIAGQRTRICTMFICLHSDRMLGRHREEIDFPRPSIKSVPPGVEVSYGEDRRPRSDVLELDVYVHVKSVGKYSIISEFPEDRYNFKPIDKSPVSFYVKPSELHFFELNSVAPVSGHGKAGSVYRGGTCEILLTARDQYGNILVESDLEFNIVPGNTFVALLSTTRDLQKERYIVTLRCNKVGTTSFRLLLLTRAYHPAVKITSLTIIPPPVSPTSSYIVQDDLETIQERIHEAGKAFTFKLALFDIFGYPITSLNESIVNIRLTCLHDCNCGDEDDRRILELAEKQELRYLKKEVDSLKAQTVDSVVQSANIFELEFTPLVSGRKRFLLFLSDKEVKNAPIKITVEPGPLGEIKIVSHEPPTLNQNVVISYPTEKRMVFVKGIDAFGNEVDLDCNEWFLSETQYVNMLEVKNYFWDEKAKMISYHYSHDKKGSYTATVKPRSSSNSYIKAPSFVIDVGPAPLDPKKCDVRIYQEQPIFTGRFRCLRLLVAFVGCTGERYVFPDRDIGHLSVKVDNTVFKPTYKHGKKHFEAYLTLPELQEGGMKKIQVRYKEVCLGCQLTVNVVGLVPFKTDDYLQIDQNERKILCIGVAQKHFFGADYANIKNMNRILEKEFPHCKLSPNNVTQEYEGLAVFDLSSFRLEEFCRVCVLLSLLVRGVQHFRNQANDFGDEKEKWKERATEAYYFKDHKAAKECKAIKEKYGGLMNESHRQASNVVFHFYNYGRPQSQIDLHGQLVGNTEKFNAYKEQLVSKGEKSAVEVDFMIKRERKERDEAIRKLDERLSSFDHEKAKRDGQDWLEIIDGAGHHSETKGKQKIRPKVKEYLETKNIKYVEANEGALLITFSEYTGKEPCVADFYCTRCKKTWKSTTSRKGLSQKCYRCDSQGTDSECYPMKMRSVLLRSRSQQTINFNTHRSHGTMRNVSLDW